MSDSDREPKPEAHLIGANGYMSSKRAAWEALIQREADLANAIQANELTDSQRQSVAQEWWAVASELLKEMARNDLPKPGMLLLRLGNFASDLSRGIDPAICKDARSRGRKMSYGERKDIATAVAYMEAAKAGRVKDHQYAMTIKAAFGVQDDKTPAKWARDPSHKAEFPQIFALSAKQLTQQMREAGLRYKSDGRSHAANVKRAKQNE